MRAPIFLFAAMFGCAVACNTVMADPPGAFERLTALAGDWEADLSGFGKLKDSIRLVSNGKAIEETIGTPADNETSIYSRDGDGVLLTHFCALTPQGHVARLALRPQRSSDGSLEFLFAGATNLPDADAPHMRRVLITFTDHDHFTERWTRTENGKDTVFDLHFIRR